jgi:hypothetical protein
MSTTEPEESPVTGPDEPQDGAAALDASTDAPDGAEAVDAPAAAGDSTRTDEPDGTSEDDVLEATLGAPW